MLKRVYIIFCLFNLIFGLACPKEIYRVVKNGINIRSDSTPLSSLLGTLEKNEIIEVLEERYDWYKIRLPKGFFGYVSSDYVKEIENNKLKVVASLLNLRSEPHLDAPVIGRIKRDTVLKTIEKNDGWYKVYSFPYGWGWVYKPFLRKIELKTFILEGNLLSLNTGGKYKANCLLKTKNRKEPLLIEHKNYKKFLKRKVKIVAKERINEREYLLVQRLSFIN